MLGDRRKINRLLKQDRRRSPDRRVANRFIGITGPGRIEAFTSVPEDRRTQDRRFSDRTKQE